MNIKRTLAILIFLSCTVAVVLYVRNYIGSQQEAQEREELFARLQLSEAQENYLFQYTGLKPGGGWNANLFSTQRFSPDILNKRFPDYTFLRMFFSYDDGIHPFIRFLDRIPVVRAFTPTGSRVRLFPHYKVIAFNESVRNVYLFTPPNPISHLYGPPSYSIEQFSSFLHDTQIVLQTETDVTEIWEVFVSLLYPDEGGASDEVEFSHPEESVLIIKDLTLCQCEYRVELTEEKTVASFRYNQPKD